MNSRPCHRLPLLLPLATIALLAIAGCVSKSPATKADSRPGESATASTASTTSSGKLAGGANAPGRPGSKTSPAPSDKDKKPGAGAKAGTGVADAKAPAEEKKPETIKPYEKVITKEAKTVRGIFVVHRIDEKVYYEIPTNQYGREFLWVSQLEKTQAGFGYGGGTQLGSRVVRWELRQKDVLLRDVKYTIRAESQDSIRKAVEATSLEPILRKFPVAAWGTNQAAVIDVTELFLGDVTEFSARNRLGAQAADRSRSFLEGVKAFPRNIETKALITYSIGGGGSGFASSNAPSGLLRRDSSQSSLSVVLHHSMVLLPEQPWHPRRWDSRVGFFSVGFESYGSVEHKVEQVRYINRWRLEKKDPSAAVSEPKTPIVFYLGRGVPEKWRPWIKKGIEAWQGPFEAAGFKNAVLAMDAPGEKEDPDWDAEDARYSTIQWLPSTIENAQGPHVHDPRTGEILEADILIYHNILKLQRDWYFSQVSPLDPRAQTLPLPDELMGELLAYVVTHEVGHSLGFPHNMKASSSYTVQELRDPEFTRQNGVEASIMDYGRFNYVAQPGDNARLIPILGPYDRFAVEWGYKEFPQDTTPAGAKKLLEAIAARQIKDPKLRFGDPNPAIDPTQQMEDLGSDPVQATELGLKNIHRIMGFLVKATCKEGEDYDLLEEAYTQVMNQRDRELNHVVGLVGGVVMNNLWYGQADRVYTPVPAERQRRAVEFLNENAFKTPNLLLPPDVLRRIESSGALDRLLASQRGLVLNLLSDSRSRRMTENAPAAGGEGGGYLPADLIHDLRTGIFSELNAPAIEVEPPRRSLQRVLVDALSAHAGRTDAGSDLPALARSELKELMEALRGALPKTRDRVTRAHLDELASRIDRSLDPRGRGQASSNALQ